MFRNHLPRQKNPISSGKKKINETHAFISGTVAEFIKEFISKRVRLKMDKKEQELQQQYEKKEQQLRQEYEQKMRFVNLYVSCTCREISKK